MKKVQIKRVFLESVEKVVRKEMINELYEWPPKCSTLLYQPKRPKNDSDLNVINKNYH